jgi:glutathione S-transferase
VLRLHDYVLSSDCYSVRLMLALLRQSYEILAVDVYPARIRDGAKDVPVLEDGEKVMGETGAMLVHLAETYDPGGTWLPRAGQDSSLVMAWVGFASAELAPLKEARLAAMLGAPGDPDALRRKGRVALRRLEDHLTRRGFDGHEWLASAGPTLADIAAFPAIALSHDSGIGHEDFPAINLWQRRVRKLPGFVSMPGIPDYF